MVLDRKAVVVVDELGLLGTRQLNAIMAAQAAKEFQLVMIGDPKQMQAVEAGPVIERVVVLGLVLGALPALFGIVIVLPVLGHASWHIYRRILV